MKTKVRGLDRAGRCYGCDIKTNTNTKASRYDELLKEVRDGLTSLEYKKIARVSYGRGDMVECLEEILRERK